jgi:hypothetical protein
MKYLLLLSFLVFNVTVFASGKYETNNHLQVSDYVYNLKNSQGINLSDVLVVYDIDNTLLAPKHDFGSAHWFSWQAKEISDQGENALAKNFDELLLLHAQIMGLMEMRLTESSVPSVLGQFQKDKITVLALTSRLPESRAGTEREIARAGVDFSLSSPGPSIAESFIPEGHTKMTSYQKGIFMTSGLDKGHMLSYLLKRFNKNYKYIIFVDDQKRHTDEVYSQFIGSGVDISTFRYGAEDLAVEAFKNSDKTEAIALGKQYIELLKALN